MRSGVVVATMIWSMSVASSPAMARARCAAKRDRSEEACSGAPIRRSRMPVRSRIHSSEVSTMRSKSWFVSTRSGTYMPVPVMVAPRVVSSRAVMVRLDLLANVLVDLVLDELDQGADGAAIGADAARPVADEAHAVDAQERGRPVLLPVDALLDPAQRGPHEERAGACKPAARQLLAHHVGEQRGDALGGLEHDVAGEAVGDDDVAAALEDVPPLDVADEVEMARGAQQRLRLEDQGVALALLL